VLSDGVPAVKRSPVVRIFSGTPFTLPHFRKWSRRLILDSGRLWRLDPWQETFVADLLSGAPEVWLIVPVGSGKTTLLAGLALYYLEHQSDASIAVAAASRDQASVLWRQAAGFVMRTPALHALTRDPLRGRRGKRELQVPRFRCVPGMRRIDYVDGGELRIYAADQNTADGIVPTLCLVDELHRHRTMGLFQLWKSKLDKRPGGQIITISTAGDPGSEFEAAREALRLDPRAKRDGCFTRLVTSEIVFHEYAVPEDGDFEDLALVKQANPLSTVTIEMLKRKRESPTWNLDFWKRYQCGVATRGGMAAITEGEWARARTDEQIPTGVPIWLGADLAFRWDTSALVPYWQRDKKFRLLGAPAVLVPPRDGSALDPRELERAALQIHARNPIHTVVIDPNKAEAFAAWCRTTLGAKVVEHKQTAAHAEIDFLRWMEALREGWLHHTGDATLTRHVFNAIARVTPYGGTRFEESHAARREGAPNQDTRVIDALAAAAAVHSAANEGAPESSAPRWRLLA